MAIIYTYPNKSDIDGSELLLISDGTEENNTKTVTTAEYGAYISATYGDGGLTIYQANGSIDSDRTLSSTPVDTHSLTFSSLLSFNVSSPSVFSSTVNLSGAITIPTGASDGYVLTSDPTGVATWQAIPDSAILTVNGTASRISVTDSGGPNPVIDIDTSYVGQATITTLGTITTGIWQGDTISIAYGGTGLAGGYTNGDMLIYDTATSSSRLTKLPIGANGEVLTISGGLPVWLPLSSLTLINTSTTYTVQAIDDTVNYTGSTPGDEARLPTAVGAIGRKIIIKNSGTVPFIVDANGLETIDGALTATLVQYESITIQSDGNNWIII